MGKALQKSTDGGSTFQQVSVDVADYTIRTGVIADRFLSVKDSQDNIYILCLKNPTITFNGTEGIPFIKIDKNGNKTVLKMLHSNYNLYFDERQALVLSRDESMLFICLNFYSGTSAIYSLQTDMQSNVFTSLGIGSLSRFAIYQDRYIWVASDTTVSVYDYNTKVELASVVVNNQGGGNLNYANSICCDTNNNLYFHGRFLNGYDGINKLVFNGVSTITQTTLLFANQSQLCKQMLIDNFGDLIILTNSGTASTLLKYTTAGVQVGTTLNLGGAYYNLNTDSDGNYYYSNDLGTYKIAANTAQGQAFNTPVKIRDNGMTTYGNNMTGYSPAVNA